MAGSTANNGVVDGGGRQRGQQHGPKCGDETTEGGPAGPDLPVHCALAAGGEEPYGPAITSTAIYDHCVPWVAGTHHHNEIDGSMACQAWRLNSLMGLQFDGLDGSTSLTLDRLDRHDGLMGLTGLTGSRGLRVDGLHGLTGLTFWRLEGLEGSRA
jgi:hypothetical protein